MDPVEVAAEVDVVLGPDLAQHLEELGAAAIALVVLEPRLAEVGELVLEPAGHDVDGEAAVGQVIGGGAELGQHRGLPQPGWTAAITFSRSVASSSARLKLVDSCWNSAP